MRDANHDHRVRVTQMMIRKAFAELLAQKPIQSISIKELCGLAGVNRGTFYAHYKDIYDLREKIENDMYRDVLCALRPLLNEEANASHLEITAGIFQWMKDNADMCAAILSEYGNRDFLLRMLNLGQVVCKESYQRMFSDMPPERIDWFYAFASSGYLGLLRKWLAENMRTPAKDIALLAEQLTSHGLQGNQSPA